MTSINIFSRSSTPPTQPTSPEILLTQKAELISAYAGCILFLLACIAMTSSVFYSPLCLVAVGLFFFSVLACIKGTSMSLYLLQLCNTSQRHDTNKKPEELPPQQPTVRDYVRNYASKCFQILRTTITDLHRPTNSPKTDPSV